MSNVKMREEFEEWLEEGIEETGTVRPSGDKVASYLAVWEGAWQAATTATQRDAMAVAEAVRDACANAARWHGHHEGCNNVDLAAIVEAAQPGQRVAVNRRMLEALKEATEQLHAMNQSIPHAASWIEPKSATTTQRVVEYRAIITAAEAAQPVVESLKVPKTRNQYGLDTPYFVRWLNRVIPSLENYTPAEFAREFGRMAAAADKDALLADHQPSSAQQQGEPVAWAAFASNGNCRIWFGDKASADNWAEATGIHGPLTPLYTAPPAPECSVPDVDVFAKVVGDFEACGETDTSQDELMQFANHGWLECTHFEVTDNGRAMLAATQKGGE